MRNHFANTLKIVAALFAAAVCSLHLQSCANTTAGPTGGPKDTIPPRITAIEPDAVRTGFPRQKGRIYITFDEYVNLKNPANEIVVSPPVRKRPEFRIRQKSVAVNFKDTLREDQTYTINFGNAIADVNENNLFRNYVYTFSTGSEIDSMIISGNVMNYETLHPMKGITVALYTEPRDSSVFVDTPVALSKTDEWGYFCVRGLKGIPYTLFAFEDKNYNNLYDKGAEYGGFATEPLTPAVAATSEDLPQLKVMDMRDTLACLSRPSEVEIYMYMEKSDNQYLVNYGRISEREMFLKFNTKGVQIDTFLIKGIYNDRIIRQFNPEGDSLTFWINDRRRLDDTLTMRLSYMKTDSTGNLSPKGETLKFIKPFDKNSTDKSRRRSGNSQTAKSYAESLNQDIRNGKAQDRDQRKQQEEYEKQLKDEMRRRSEEKRPDLLEFTLTANPESVENLGIDFRFKAPLIKSQFDSIGFTRTTPRQITSDVPFRIEKDTTDLLHYVMFAEEAYKAGNDYMLRIPTGIFMDINGFTNDSTEKKFNLPTNDRLSSITLDVVNTKGGKYIVELVNEKRDKVFLKYVINSDKELIFPYLTAGRYSFRITEDLNRNGKLDVGDVLRRIPPEKARLLKLKSGSAIIELKEQTDLTQSADIEEIFK